ncbi:uncharacterized protein LOC122279339 isoform X1 [Carya illinoinensis]|uniref:Gag1-like clamp domain-containing protein n=1 Tax=Carya illinoinensis TaxID=32201 RepID=A0A8T1PAU7_CARIL|nr:uncharacterized protein LOC122279339 isoform X1 [Carya illinoinensis]XP_042945863.1 uncharacterized protein LOC122279339 isoform X1 [Carya illinoinensis]XP_042945864.1 uncharacterized protein LOC122279339 isoform X1 [Carya illinoinensis]XP_042945865.1 uncharacterized protein LOC122279339 isoform X1 [Carya illinoinensis]XP_042945866.1 uncharacterized protein LOC122279339 isoform X1 [Carya illinoinensis]KAG6639815.1 hypothetical protein CIPAW_10G128800 [Carya illinoinensis]
MEGHGNNLSPNGIQPSGGSNNFSAEKPGEKEGFVNHAKTAWHERRREWVGDHSKKSQRAPRKPTMGLVTADMDRLLSSQPYQQLMPLPVLVALLVEIWIEEGLYD